MDIQALQQRLRDFAAARNWQPYHSPKNLAMALMVEAAELLELFQWLTTEQSHTLTRDAADKERVGDEMADVLLYLLQLADCTGVDVEQAVEHKLRKNAGKHPAKHQEKPAPGPKSHLLIDWENVQPRGPELRALAPEGSDVWLFHGPQQKVDASSHLLAFGARNVILVPRSGTGKNALDFQLSYYIGYISARQPQGRFVVVSNDTGYDPMLEHARELGFDARRREFRRPPVLPVQSPTKPKPAPAALNPKPLSPPSVPFAALPPAAPATEPSAAQMAWRAIVHLRKLPLKSRPTLSADGQALVEALIREPVRDKAALAQRAWVLVRARRLGLARAPDAWRPAVEASQAPSMPAAPKTTVRPVAAQPSAAAKKSVAAPKAAVVKQGAKKPLTPTVAKKAAPQTSKVVAPAANKATPMPVATQIALYVLASLKKMPGNMPTRRAGVVKFIETHAAKAADPKSMAQQVCALLEARKHVALSSDGKSVSYPKIGEKKAASA